MRYVSPIKKWYTWFVVMEVTTKDVVYEGLQESAVALVSRPGTCFGYGRNKQQAYDMAMRIATRAHDNAIRMEVQRNEGIVVQG